MKVARDKLYPTEMHASAVSKYWSPSFCDEESGLTGLCIDSLTHCFVSLNSALMYIEDIMVVQNRLFMMPHGKLERYDLDEKERWTKTFRYGRGVSTDTLPEDWYVTHRQQFLKKLWRLARFDPSSFVETK